MKAILPCVLALGMSALSSGCKDDTAAVKALEELNAQLSEQLAEGNELLANMAEKLDTCMKDLAETKGEAVVITTTEVTVETPSLEGEATVPALETLKQALNDTLAEQKDALSALKSRVDQCATDLAAAEKKAEAAAAKAKANEAASAKKRPGAKKKPTAVKQAEEQGTPTKGVRSRY